MTDVIGQTRGEAVGLNVSIEISLDEVELSLLFIDDEVKVEESESCDETNNENAPPTSIVEDEVIGTTEEKGLLSTDDAEDEAPPAENAENTIKESETQIPINDEVIADRDPVVIEGKATEEESIINLEATQEAPEKEQVPSIDQEQKTKDREEDIPETIVTKDDPVEVESDSESDTTEENEPDQCTQYAFTVPTTHVEKKSCVESRPMNIMSLFKFVIMSFFLYVLFDKTNEGFSAGLKAQLKNTSRIAKENVFTFYQDSVKAGNEMISAQSLVLDSSVREFYHSLDTLYQSSGDQFFQTLSWLVQSEKRELLKLVQSADINPMFKYEPIVVCDKLAAEDDIESVGELCTALKVKDFKKNLKNSYLVQKHATPRQLKRQLQSICD